MPDLKALLYNEKPDLLAITETWLTDSVLDAEILIPGYNIFRKDRQDKRGGGVLFLIQNALEVEYLDNFSSKEVESIWCLLKLNHFSIHLGLFYRPPNYNNEQNKILFDEIRRHLNFKNLIILGDFNFPCIDWKALTSSYHSEEFLELCLDGFLTQMVHDSTRNDNILDLVLTSDELLVTDVYISTPFSGSDHNSIFFTIPGAHVKPDCKQAIPDFNKGNYIKMREAVSNVDWIELLNDKDTDTSWSIFKNLLADLQERHVPIKKTKKPKPKWFNNNIKILISRKRNAWRRYKKSRQHRDYLIFKDLEKHLKIKIRLQKANLEEHLAVNINNNPKAFYAYSNSKNFSPIPALIVGNSTVNLDKEKANALNDFFHSVYSKEKDDKVPIIVRENNNSCSRLVITKDMIMDQIQNLKVNKSPGPDGIFPRLLKELSDFCLPALEIIFNKSLNENVVPVDWRQANIKPLFKKGKRTDPSNYRPISLTSICCKMMESIIKRHIVDYLEANTILYDSQHGFRQGRSCLSNLLEYLEFLTAQVDNKSDVDVIYLDFAKAFDKVPHNKLLSKINAVGITGNIYQWIAAWLKHRRQRVVINGSASKWLPVESGVPQGSVLGPVLFLIFVNDLDDVVQCKISKFADDTKLFREITSNESSQALQNDLNMVATWCANWGMKLNLEKCVHLPFGKNRSDEVMYYIDDEIITKRHSIKDLGITISTDLKPEVHISEIVSKAYKILGLIKRTLSCKKSSVILPLYIALVRPILEYGAQAWSPLLQKDINKLEIVQKRALRIMSDIRHLSYPEKLAKLNLYSLEYRRLRGDLIETFKILKGYTRVDISTFFTLFNSLEISTRGHLLKLEKHRFHCNTRKFFFSNRVVDIWNSLPHDVVSIETVNGFKTKLDKILKSRGYS